MKKYSVWASRDKAKNSDVKIWHHKPTLEGDIYMDKLVDSEAGEHCNMLRMDNDVFKDFTDEPLQEGGKTKCCLALEIIPDNGWRTHTGEKHYE